MARRHRRHYRGFGDLVSLPSFSGLSMKDYNPLGKSVNSTDLLIGAGVGIAGGTLVGIGIQKLDAMVGGKIPDFVKSGPYAGSIATVLGGAIASAFLRKKSPARANGIFVGAVAAAAVPVLAQVVAMGASAAGLSGYVSIPGLSGMLVDDYAGLLVDDPQMAGLAAFSMSDDEDLLEAA